MVQLVEVQKCTLTYWLLQYATQYTMLSKTATTNYFKLISIFHFPQPISLFFFCQHPSCLLVQTKYMVDFSNQCIFPLC